MIGCITNLTAVIVQCKYILNKQFFYMIFSITDHVMPKCQAWDKSGSSVSLEALEIELWFRFFYSLINMIVSFFCSVVSLKLVYFVVYYIVFK